jgi:replicative DNA helicase
LATKELQTINSVLKNKDIKVLFSPSVDDLFIDYGDVWQAIKDYHHKYHAVPDFEVLEEQFPDLERVDVNGHSSYYLDELKNEYRQNRIERLLLKAGNDLSASNSQEILEALQKHLGKLNRFSSNARNFNIMDFEEAERSYEETRERAEAMGGTPGIPTGINFIDSAYPAGFSPGDLVVVLGWTGRGKSLLSTLICCNAHDKGMKPMMVSLEMSEKKLRDRVYTIKGSGVFSNTDLSLGVIDPDDFRQFRAEHENAPDFLVVTDDGGDELTPNYVQSLIDQHHPDIVVLDYAQLASDNDNTTDMTPRMRNMSKQYKRLAEANGIVVILISSATPDSTASANEPPRVEQVAWSKQLSYDADLAFAVHKHEDSNIIEVAGRKNRNGPLFDGFLDWDIDRGKVREIFDDA